MKKVLHTIHGDVTIFFQRSFFSNAFFFILMFFEMMFHDDVDDVNMSVHGDVIRNDAYEFLKFCCV